MRLRNSEHKETKSWSSIVSETYKDFAENTSIHGLKYTVKNEIGSCEKIFWFFVVLSGLCGAGYMTVLFWERYTSNPTRTTILTSYARVNSMPFPAVTICNINRILLMNMEKLLDTMPADSRDRVILKESLPQLLSFNYNNHRYLNVSQLDDLNSVLIANHITDISYLVKSLGQSCEEMLEFCRWGTEYIKCSEYFEASLTTDGYCCSFNYLRNDVLYTSLNGVSTGLVVVLDPMLQNTQYSSLHAAGFKVIIHDPTEYPGAQSRSKIISPGNVAYLQIVGTKMVCSEAVKQLPITQRDCIYGDEGPTKAFQVFEGPYSDSNCLTECEAADFYARCGCVPYYYAYFGEYICQNQLTTKCFPKLRSTFQIELKLRSIHCAIVCLSVRMIFMIYFPLHQNWNTTRVCVYTPSIP
nr:unnamed protein product [Callosobruchus chinensis]